jgi:hypothetical protein
LFGNLTCFLEPIMLSQKLHMNLSYTLTVFALICYLLA